MRTEEPPGTTRTRSFTVNRRRGKVSLSTKERPVPSPISVSSPSRKPSRMPRFTQAFTNQSLPFFSAARILPCVRASRKSRKVCRAFGSRSTSPGGVRRSMAAFNASMRREVYRERIPQRRDQGGRWNRYTTASFIWVRYQATVRRSPSSKFTFGA